MDSSSAEPARSWERRLAGLVAVWVFFHLSAGSFVMNDDGADMLLTAVRLARAERPRPTNYGVGQSLLLLPVAASIEPERWPESPGIRARDNWRIKLVPTFVAALGVLTLHELVRRLGASRGAAASVAAIAAVASPLWPYAESLFAETTLVTCLLAGLLPLARRRASTLDLALCGTALGFGGLTKPAFALPALTVAALAASGDVRTPGRILALGLPLAASAVGALAWNAFRFGGVLDFGYTTGTNSLGFSLRSALSGIPGLLVSPGKGVVFYAPVLALALVRFRPFARANPRFAFAVAAVFVESLVIHGSWWAWPGDWAWGPRFLVPVVPPLLAAIALPGRGLARVLAVVLVVASAFVQVTGVLVHHATHLKLFVSALDAAGRGTQDPVTRATRTGQYFEVSLSPILSHTWLLVAACRGDPDIESTCPWRSLPPREWWAAERACLRTPPPLDLWALDGSLPGRSARVGLELALGLAGLALALRPRTTRATGPPLAGGT